MDPKLSGRDNILVGGLAMGMSAKEAKQRTRRIARFAGIRKFLDVPLRAYSSGMRSRLQFSIATTTRPEILIVDEALATGDREFKRKAVKRLRRMLHDDGTLLFVSHNEQQVRRICTRVIWLEAGQVVMDGPGRRGRGGLRSRRRSRPRRLILRRGELVELLTELASRPFQFPDARLLLRVERSGQLNRAFGAEGETGTSVAFVGYRLEQHLTRRLEVVRGNPSVLLVVLGDVGARSSIGEPQLRAI